MTVDIRKTWEPQTLSRLNELVPIEAALNLSLDRIICTKEQLAQFESLLTEKERRHGSYSYFRGVPFIIEL